MQALKLKAGLIIAMGYINMVSVPVCVYLLFNRAIGDILCFTIVLFMIMTFTFLGITCLNEGYKEKDNIERLEKEHKAAMQESIRKMREAIKKEENK